MFIRQPCYDGKRPRLTPPDRLSILLLMSIQERINWPRLHRQVSSLSVLLKSVVAAKPIMLLRTLMLIFL